MKYECELLIALIFLSALGLGKQAIVKRALPTNFNCDPRLQVCRKGDWTPEDVAGCYYRGSKSTCTAVNEGHSLSWIVDEDRHGDCRPLQGLQFLCGAAGTHTRCVCSDVNIFYSFFTKNRPLHNQCKCQYWPNEDIGARLPAFCTGYYIGGKSTVHHWICCNNCNDREANTCDRKTWQGGSDLNYCGECGDSTGNGKEKYFFNCGSCKDQHRCESKCNSPAWMKLPGLCWLWADCFKDCCVKLPLPLKLT